MNSLYNIVKEAVDNKVALQLLSAKYYLSEDIANDASNMLYKKAVATKNINGLKIIHKIESYNDYLNIVKNGTISIYEPIVEKTKSFRIGISNELPKSQLLNSLVIIRNRLIEAGFIADIVKYDGHYGIKCLSKEEYKTCKNLPHRVKNFTASVSTLNGKILNMRKSRQLFFSPVIHNTTNK